MKPISVLSNGIQLFKDDFWRGWAAALGLIKLPNIPYAGTNNIYRLKEIRRMGGFGFIVTRLVKPNFFQKQITGVTRSPWGHAKMLIGEEIGKATRRKYPDLLDKIKSPRWKNPKKGYPVPMIQGIRINPSKFEVVESNLYVEITDFGNITDKQEEQAIFFTDLNWSTDQKIEMAREAYTWVGEPYDVFEIGSWISSIFPNTKRLKTCGTLVGKILSLGKIGFIEWIKLHGLDIEKIAPREIFAFGTDNKNYKHFCFHCLYQDAIHIKT